MFPHFIKICLIWTAFVSFTTAQDEAIYRETYSGSQHLIVKIPRKNWLQSVEWCAQNNLSLASFKNDAEFNFAIGLARRAGLPNKVFEGDLFIGASRLVGGKDFTWIPNNQIVPKSFWTAGEPNNYGGRENCVTMFYGKGGDYKLNDDNCLALRSFMCVSRK